MLELLTLPPSLPPSFFPSFPTSGVVGVALQYYGTAIAFLVAHFASDSGGKKRWERRDEDAWRTLHMLHLAGTSLLSSLPPSLPPSLPSFCVRWSHS